MPTAQKPVTLSPEEIEQLRQDYMNAQDEVRCLALVLAHNIEIAEREPERAQELKAQNEEFMKRIDRDLEWFWKQLNVALGLRPRDECARPE